METLWERDGLTCVSFHICALCIAERCTNTSLLPHDHLRSLDVSGGSFGLYYRGCLQVGLYCKCICRISKISLRSH